MLVKMFAIVPLLALMAAVPIGSWVDIGLILFFYTLTCLASPPASTAAWSTAIASMGESWHYTHHADPPAPQLSLEKLGWATSAGQTRMPGPQTHSTQGI